MSTRTGSWEQRAVERRRRKRARAEQRRRDRGLAPVAVAQRLGIPVAELARAMRAVGVHEQLTETQARQWNTDLETTPEWLAAPSGERLALEAEGGYRRQQREEERQLRELAAEQSAMGKVKAGKTRFSDDEWLFVQDWAFQAAKELVRSGPVPAIGDLERQALRLVGVDVGDHSTWPIHAGGCAGEGPERCAVRMEELRAARRADTVEAVNGPLLEATYALKSGQRRSGWFDLLAIQTVAGPS